VTGAVTAGVALAVTAGAAVYSAVESGHTQSQARGQSGTVFGEQQQYAQQLAKLISDPSSVKDLPGFQFQMQQGSEAVARQMAASGFLGSGNEATALTQYGQGLAQSFYGQQSNLLASLAGLTAPSSPSQLTGAATGANQNSFNQFMQLAGQAGQLYGRYGQGANPGFTSNDISLLASGGYSNIGPTMPGGGGYTQNTPGWPGG
jgi:hypothetical protein